MRKGTLYLTCLILFWGGTLCAGIDQNLVAYWSFDQDFTDQQGSHDLTAGNGVSIGPGRFGTAAIFDGSQQGFLTTVAPTPLAMGENSFSVSLWVKPQNSFKNGRLLDHRGTGPGGQHPGWQLRLRQDQGQWHFRGSALDDGAGGFKSCNGCGQSYSVNAWYHVVMVYLDDDRLEFYVNGQLDGTKAVGSLGSLNQNFPLVLGGALVKKGVLTAKAAQRFIGSMDEVRVYDRALSQTEITELFAQPNQPNPPAFTAAYVDYLGEFAAASHSLGFFYLDSDTSGNGIPDFQLTGPDDDLDGDGLANRVDTDDDGDGIADLDDKAGYLVATGPQAGWAPLTGSTPAAFFNHGETAAAAGLHPDDFWQFVPNGIYEQTGFAFTDGTGQTFPKVFLNPAANLYIDQYDRAGALVSDGIPDALQAALGSNCLPSYVLERDFTTTHVDRSTLHPGLLGSWPTGETGQTLFYLADDDMNTTTSPQFANDFPYNITGRPTVTDIYDAVDGSPDYAIYGTTLESDPAIPNHLKVDDPLGVRLWRYRKAMGMISHEREVVFFLTVYFNSGGRTNQTYYSRAAFNEPFGFFGRNSTTTGDDFGLDSGAIALGISTPSNWFPNFQSLPDHNSVAQYAFGLDWLDIATATQDGSSPLANLPANQAWVDRYENFSSANRIVNYLDIADALASGSAVVPDLLTGRYGIDLNTQDTRLILRREAGGNAHMAAYALGTPTQGYLLSWEDIFAGGNRNFVDVVFFTNLPNQP